MNRIYWDKDSIGMVTDHIDATLHSHPMMQLFLSIGGLLEIEVSGKKLSCRCVVVDKNIPHAFNTKGKRHVHWFAWRQEHYRSGVERRL